MCKCLEEGILNEELGEVPLKLLNSCPCEEVERVHWIPQVSREILFPPSPNFPKCCFGSDH